MAVNKVILNGEVLVDLTADTVTADKVEAGLTFHKADGTEDTGTLVIPEPVPLPPKFDSTQYEVV